MDDVPFTVVDTKGVVSLQKSMRVIKHRGHHGFIASCPQSLIKSHFLHQVSGGGNLLVSTAWVGEGNPIPSAIFAEAWSADGLPPLCG